MGRYYEDFSVGARFVSSARTIGEYEVSSFAGLSGDFNPLHTDHEFASSTAFGGRVAHGVLGLSVATGLIARTGLFDGTAVAFLGIEGWRFMAPICLGDTVHVEFEITSMRETSNPETGIVARYVELVNQNGKIAQAGEMILMLRRRPIEN